MDGCESTKIPRKFKKRYLSIMIAPMDSVRNRTSEKKARLRSPEFSEVLGCEIRNQLRFFADCDSQHSVLILHMIEISQLAGPTQMLVHVCRCVHVTLCMKRLCLLYVERHLRSISSHRNSPRGGTMFRFRKPKTTTYGGSTGPSRKPPRTELETTTCSCLLVRLRASPQALPRQPAEANPAGSFSLRLHSQDVF